MIMATGDSDDSSLTEERGKSRQCRPLGWRHLAKGFMMGIRDNNLDEQKLFIFLPF